MAQVQDAARQDIEDLCTAFVDVHQARETAPAMPGWGSADRLAEVVEARSRGTHPILSRQSTIA